LLRTRALISSSLLDRTIANGPSLGFASAMFLIDTNVVSETRRARPHQAVLAWIEEAPPGSLFYRP